jgi:hypothetical protein
MLNMANTNEVHTGSVQIIPNWNATLVNNVAKDEM